MLGKASAPVYSDGVHIWVNVNASLYRRAAQRCAMWFTATVFAHISQCHPFMQQRFEFSCVTSAIKAELLVQTDLKSFMLYWNAASLPNHKGGDSKMHYWLKYTDFQTKGKDRQINLHTKTHYVYHEGKWVCLHLLVSNSHGELRCLRGIPLCCVSVCPCSFSYPAV